MAGKGEVYKRRDGNWAFRVRASNGEVVATDGGQGYQSQGDAQATLEKLMNGAYDGSIVDLDASAFTGAPTQHQMRMEIEAFVHIWIEVSPDLALDPETRLVGDALARMANDLVKSEDPPTPVLREAFLWFSKKVDAFAEEFAKSAGKATGTAAGVAIGLAATGQIPKLATAISRVLSHLP